MENLVTITERRFLELIKSQDTVNDLLLLNKGYADRELEYKYQIQALTETKDELTEKLNDLKQHTSCDLGGGSMESAEKLKYAEECIYKVEEAIGKKRNWFSLQKYIDEYKEKKNSIDCPF